MGILRQGILGGFRNKAGSVVGSYWRTLDVIKGLPRMSGKAATPAQILQRDKFRIVTSGLTWIAPIIQTGFKAKSKIATPMNLAVAYHLENAIKMTAGVPGFDWTKLKFSEGKVVVPTDVSAGTGAAGSIDFEWSNVGTDNRFKAATDKATVLVYNEDKDTYIFYENIVARSAGAYNMLLPGDFSGDQVYAYISFNSVTEKELVSNSMYLGKVPVL